MSGNEGRDGQVRLAAFAYLDRQSQQLGDVLPRSVLDAGFTFEGEIIRLIGPQGIFKPASLEIPLTITTAPEKPGKTRPYEDEWLSDTLLRYRYRGTDPNHHDNVRLRRAMTEGVPLIYLDGIEPGRYAAVYPVYVVADDPTSLAFTIADESGRSFGQNVVGQPLASGYAMRLTKQRLHQVAFRHRVLTAYGESCSFCRLKRRELLDAAHIVRDSDMGRPVVSNGLSLCKLHHSAFDVNLMGVRPDLVIEVRPDVLEERDGPMLLHGLQGFQGREIYVPRRHEQRPDPEALERRYDEFRAAG